MADVITRLKLESGEYDSKIKRATQGLLQMEEECRKVGGTLAYLEDEQKQYVQSLGQMDTVSRNVRGKLAELTAAYTELRVQYQRLTDEEKQGDYGKALSSSLEQLKARIGETKSQLNEAGKEIGSSDSLLDKLASKFTINVDAVKLFNMGLQAAEAALNVAKDAFFNNEEQLDEWGRVVESSHSLYTGFLNALNTGDISGYLSNIDQIVKAARDAYDALDTLGTYNAFNQINIERTRTNMTESIADYRGGKGSKDAVKAAGEAYKKELQDRKRMENDAYIAAIKRVAAERGVSAKDLTDALSGTYGHYQDLKKVQPTGVRQTVVGSGMYARIGTEKFAQNRQEKLGEALRHLNDTELQSLQALGAQAQRTGTEIAQVDKQLTRVLNGRQPGATGGGGGGTTHRTTPKTDEVIPAGSVEAATKKVQDLQKAWRLAADDDSREKINKQIEQAQLMLDVLTGKVNADTLKIDIVDDNALNRLGEIDGWHFDPKTLEIVVESREAWAELQKVEGITFSPKTLPILSPQELVKGRIEDATRSQDVGTTPAFDFSKALGDTKATITAEALAVDQESFNTLLRTAVENGINSMDGQFAMLGEKLAQGINIPDSAWEDLQNQINEKLQNGIEPIKLDFATGELSNEKSSRKGEGRQMQQVVSGLQSVAGGLQQMGIELPKSVQMLQSMISGVMTVVQGVQSIIIAAKIAETTNTATLSTNTAAVLSMTDMMMVKSMSSIASFGFANGGVVKAARGFTVPGTHFSGDVTPILANAGEVVLNRAQVGNLASILEGGSQSNLHLETRVDAEDLIFVLNNNAKRRGRGTYIKQ